MLKTLVEKEIRDIIGSSKFTITFAACALLIIMTFYAGAARHKLNMEQFNASRAEQLRSMEGITDWMDLQGTRIFLPPQPLAALVSGISNDIGRTAHVDGRGSVPTKDSRFNEDPIFAVFRFIDLDFVFAVILSLFAILLGYDTISGEKEQGTLRLSFSNALPRRTYIISKLAGAFITLTVAVMLALLIGILVMIIMGIGLTANDWISLLLIIVSGFLYFSVFLSLSIFVSTLTHRSANSFLILLVIWVMCIHIVPRASVLLAARSVNVPSVDEIAYKKAGLNAQLMDEFTESMKDMTIPATGTPDDDPVRQINEFMDSLSTIRDTKFQAYSSRLIEERHNRQKMQEDLAFTLARISPATSYTLASSHLAGTSTQLKNHFYDRALAYQKEYGDFIREKTGVNAGGMIIKASITTDDGSGAPVKPEPIDPSELPGFDIADPGTEVKFATAAVDMGILAIFNLIFFAGAVLAFARYDVR